jgi:steroid Delta-isomerase
MAGPAFDVIKQFGAVEDDQRYTRLVELFTDDAIYYDPFFGPQRGKPAIADFMAEMERVVPASGARFDAWEIEADTNVAWARWTMWARGSDGADLPVRGQSLYRLRDGMVSFAADYVDSRDYAALRPGGKRPVVEGAAGLSCAADRIVAPGGPAEALVRQFWSIQNSGRYSQLGALFAPDGVFTDIAYGHFDGHAAVQGYLNRMERDMADRSITFELVDCAGDEHVAWSQWNCHVAGGVLAGWTLHTLRDGLLTLDADYFDVLEAKRLQQV